ncbi:nodulation protein NfeD [candidate division KSB1 bacterium]|nr:nodulation protein NfeD [candidate division KSB1 bacterium]
MMRFHLFIVFCLIGVMVAGAQSQEPLPRVLKIVIDGDINPVSANYIIDNIERAHRKGYECLLIQMDTPGGLLESTKSIVKELLSSPVPVVIYVSPSGSGAVSAGVFITMAGHIAAMAEGTNIGAAHPVGIGGQQDTSQVMGEKVTNWASAWIRGIAEKRGRNADWAEQAVRRSVSINETEALEINVIDYICADEQELLQVIDGKSVQIEGAEPKILRTRTAAVDIDEMKWHQRILYKISNPTIAYILLMLGIYGIFFELQNPGAMIPGIAGAIFLILAFFALQTLPVRTAGILLILLAIGLFILEVNVTSYGILSVGGVVALFLGSLMLFEQAPGFHFAVDWRIALTIAVATGLFFFFAMGFALKARLTRPTTGKEGLVQACGVAITPIFPERDGDVKIKGEIWHATSSEKIKKNEPIIVVEVDGLVLHVRKHTRRSDG